jgi:hypothetical protein
VLFSFLIKVKIANEFSEEILVFLVLFSLLEGVPSCINVHDYLEDCYVLSIQLFN